MNPEQTKFLSENERTILEQYLATKPKAPLSVATSLKFYELFFNGYSCDEIVRVNDGNYPLGMVLQARVIHAWDERREKALAELYSGIVDKVRQTQTSAVAFIADMLAVAHKQHGDKLKRYLAGGDENLLGDFNIASLHAYQKVADTLLKLTGQSGGPGGGGSKIQVIGNNVAIKTEDGAPRLGGNMGSGQANKILRFLETEDADDSSSD